MRPSSTGNHGGPEDAERSRVWVVGMHPPSVLGTLAKTVTLNSTGRASVPAQMRRHRDGRPEEEGGERAVSGFFSLWFLGALWS